MNEAAIIIGISFFVSIISGIVGLGGAIVLIPAYLYLPPLLGMNSPDIKTISAITSIQVFATSLIGVLVHRKRGSVKKELLLFIGIPMMIAALAGALVSGIIPSHFIISAFAIMASAGAVLMFFKAPADKEVSELNFNRNGAVALAVIVGFFGGIVGAPGAFLLAPLMITVLKIPVRITIGSTLGIVLFTAFTASAGKIITGQVDYLLTLYAVIGSSAGVIIGSNLSYKINAAVLRISLAVIILGIAVEMLVKLFL